MRSQRVKESGVSLNGRQHLCRKSCWIAPFGFPTFDGIDDGSQCLGHFALRDI